MAGKSNTSLNKKKWDVSNYRYFCENRNNTCMSDILLITPPFTQLNTPYPAGPFLKGFLNSLHFDVAQMDLGIEVILHLFSKKGLREVFDFAEEKGDIETDNALRIYALRNVYINTIDAVMLFLQGHNNTLARQITGGEFLPRASRFNQLGDTELAFGKMGLQDKAKFLATLYLEDLSDFIVECVDTQFGFSRYAERLGRSANSFDELYFQLQQDKSFVDNITLTIFIEKLKTIQPKMFCFSVPFPGNLFSALRCAQYLKQNHQSVKIVMGGGFANTELRSVSDARVFEFFDFITLDDGERPLELLANLILKDKNNNKTMTLKRTFVLQNGEVVFVDNSDLPDYKQRDLFAPDFSDLKLNRYISVIELPNPMHTLWSDGRWNKLFMAHGCYWGKCAFCDGSLPYIKHFDPIPVNELVDRMEKVIEQTGETGFHFVDEAAPPALMTALAIEIIKRKLTVSWWTNVRFEKHFTPDVCRLLKASGCIAVAGGLEVASDRLLKLINKGVTVEQVAKVTHNFTEAGIMVHAYLMYGFPSQTVQETVDSLEMVRQLFELGIVQSAFWHRFALTAHSPVGLAPSNYGAKAVLANITFANNDVQFTDGTGIDHGRFGFGLEKSLFNYMHGVCFDHPLQNWFDFKIPKTSVSHHFISTCINTLDSFQIKPNAKIVWLGGEPEAKPIFKTKKGRTFENLRLIFHSTSQQYEMEIDRQQGEWLISLLPRLSVNSNEHFTWQMMKDDFELHFDNFELFWFSKPLANLRKSGLLCL